MSTETKSRMLEFIVSSLVLCLKIIENKYFYKATVMGRIMNKGIKRICGDRRVFRRILRHTSRGKIRFIKMI